MNFIKKYIINLILLQFNFLLILFFFVSDQFNKFETNLPIFLIILIILNFIFIFIKKKLYKINYFCFLFFSYFLLIVAELNYDKIFINYCNTSQCKIEKIKKEEKLNLKLNILPKHFIKNEKFIPLSSFSNKYVIGTNENGYFPIHKTDSYGFFNQKNFYNKPIDVLILGDSFAQGITVNPDENIQGNLNKFNIKNISLGMGGNGPLLSLATLMEFKEIILPKNIFFIFTENNDLYFDLFLEKENKLLTKYLLDNYSQNLISKRDKIEKFLEISNSEIIAKSKVKKNEFMDIIKIRKIRRMMKLHNDGKEYDYKKDDILEKIGSYKNIDEKIIKSKKISSNIFILNHILLKMKTIYPNSNFYFLYLPSKKNLVLKNKSNLESVLSKILFKKKINFISLTDEVNHLNKKQIKEMYPANYQHFNKRGYEFIAKLISKLIVLR